MPLELLQVGVVALDLSVKGLVQPRVPGQHVPLEPEASLVIEANVLGGAIFQVPC